jgi:hypothetical protein
LGEQSPTNLLDKSTRGDTDYKPLKNDVRTIIANHATQHQCVENHVQRVFPMRKTNVTETRATTRVIINYFIIHRFNVRLVAEKKAKITNEATRVNVVQIKYKERIMGFAGYIDNFGKGIVEMETLSGHEAKMKGIVDKMKSTKSKTSAIEHTKAVASFGNAAKKKGRIIAAETKTEGAHITAAVGKQMIFNYLGVSKPGHKTTVDTDKS